MASTVLTYTISPVDVSAGSTGNTFTVTAKNNTDAAVTFQSSDSIRIDQLTQLTAGTVTPKSPGGNWQLLLQAGVLKAFVTKPTTLQTGQSVPLVFSNVTALATPAIAQLAVVESIGGVVRNASLPVTIQAALSVVATASPSTVGALHRTQLQWHTVGASYVTISPGPPKQYPVPDGNTEVVPAQNQPTTVYTVSAVPDTGTPASTAVTVTLAPQQINSFNATSATTGASLDDPIVLTWETTYASSVQIQPQTGSPTVGTSGTLKIDPKTVLMGNENQVVFTLTASGSGAPVTATVTITFAPMQILWFRWTDYTEKSFSFSVQNSLLAQVTNSNPYTLTATGPGGPLTQQLGGSNLEVQVLFSTPATTPAGTSAILQYQIGNATSATLSPGNLPLTIDPSTGQGSISVSPSGTTDYTVTATNGTQSVTSLYTLVVTS